MVKGSLALKSRSIACFSAFFAAFFAAFWTAFSGV